MTRFIASRLDLSRLRNVRPDLILDLDYEKILQERLDAIKAERPELDAIDLESSPLKILQEQDAYRQLLDYHLLNTTLRGLLPAFSTGVNLEHIAARTGIVRLQIGTKPDTGEPVWEDDDTFRMRYFASFGAPAAGSEDAYVFAAMTAYPGAWHVNCAGRDEHGIPGQVDIVVTAPGGQPVEEADLIRIARACNTKSVRPLTDQVNVLAAEVLEYEVELLVDIMRGPDPAEVRAAVIARLGQIVAERYRGAGEVPLSALAAAGYDNGAVSVQVVKPAADIPRNHLVAPYAKTITVTVQERLYD